jgi:hypothetical protein
MSRDAEIEPLVGDLDGAGTAVAFIARESQRCRLIGEEATGETMGFQDDPMVGTVAPDDEMHAVFGVRGSCEPVHESPLSCREHVDRVDHHAQQKDEGGHAGKYEFRPLSRLASESSS